MLGTYERHLDSKNRLVIPAKLKNALGNIVFVTIGPDTALEVRSKAEFEILTKKLNDKNMLSKKIRSLKRVLFANTCEISIDKLGRILIPDNLLTKAAIKFDVVIIGMGNKLEIWNSENYQKFDDQNSGPESIENLHDELYIDGEEL